jgi:osmotically-inducible protein OsmY
MMRKVTPLVAALWLAITVAACTTLTGRTAGRNLDDASITAAVKAHLASDQARTLTSVDVDTVSGTVYLNGTVKDRTAKDQAEALAHQVDGVKRVVNNLQARPTTAGDAPSVD